MGIAPSPRLSMTQSQAATRQSTGSAAPSGAFNFHAMRMHALRSFFEDTCDSVANAFDLMARAALHPMGGTPGERINHRFSQEAFQENLEGMGYGIGASREWWHALFTSIDRDRDGAIS